MFFTLHKAYVVYLQKCNGKRKVTEKMFKTLNPRQETDPYCYNPNWRKELGMIYSFISVDFCEMEMSGSAKDKNLLSVLREVTEQQPAQEPEQEKEATEYSTETPTDEYDDGKPYCDEDDDTDGGGNVECDLITNQTRKPVGFMQSCFLSFACTPCHCVHAHHAIMCVHTTPSCARTPCHVHAHHAVMCAHTMSCVCTPYRCVCAHHAVMCMHTMPLCACTPCRVCAHHAIPHHVRAHHTIVCMHTMLCACTPQHCVHAHHIMCVHTTPSCAHTPCHCVHAHHVMCMHTTLCTPCRGVHFSQISLQSHVTTHLSQSEGSILSNLSDLVRNCEISPKIFPPFKEQSCYNSSAKKW